MTDLLTNIFESPHKMQVDQSEELKRVFQSLLSTADIRRQEIRVFQIEVNGPKTSGAENQGFSFPKREIETRTRPCSRSSERRKSEREGNQSDRDNSERADSIRWIT